MTTQPAGTLRRLLIDLSCLSCGDADQLLVEDLHKLPPLPRPCARCRGSAVAAAVAVRYVPDPDYKFDFWAPDGAPRVGRPPKWLVEQRRRRPQAPGRVHALRTVHQKRSVPLLQGQPGRAACVLLRTQGELPLMTCEIRRTTTAYTLHGLTLARLTSYVHSDPDHRDQDEYVIVAGNGSESLTRGQSQHTHDVLRFLSSEIVSRGEDDCDSHVDQARER